MGVDACAVELGVQVSRYPAQWLSVLSADPVSVLHDRQRKLNVSLSVDINSGAGPSTVLSTNWFAFGEQLCPRGDRGILRHFGEIHLDPGLAPPADQLHQTNGIQAGRKEVRLRPDRAGILLEEIRYCSPQLLEVQTPLGHQLFPLAHFRFI